MNNLKIGFGRCDITPAMGISIDGYFIDRIADGVLDSLEVNAMAAKAGNTTVLFLALDSLGVNRILIAKIKKKINQKTGILAENIILSSSHTHTGPHNDETIGNEKVPEYFKFMMEKCVDAAQFAIEDLKPAKMGWRVGKAPNVAFVRRFRMKDGSVRTNPGANNPDIDCPIGDVDESVSVLRFDRENADSIVLINFANHPDVVGGCKISGDWPALTRHTVERCIPNVKSIFINGTQGDVNHVNVHPEKGDNNDLANDFDDVMRGYGHAQHIANVVTGAVMQVFSKVNYVDVENITCIERKINVPSNMPEKKDIPLAKKYKELHENGKDSEIPYSGMELTTVVAEALRMINLENGPESFEMEMTGVSFGDIAFITIPGEGFTYIGRELKKTKGFSLVIPCGLSNGYEGYFPTKEAYDEGGYEARSSKFKSGVAEYIVSEGTDILDNMYNKNKH